MSRVRSQIETMLGAGERQEASTAISLPGPRSLLRVAVLSLHSEVRSYSLCPTEQSHPFFHLIDFPTPVITWYTQATVL